MADTFAFQIDKFAQESISKSILITKKTSIDLFNSVVDDTPVDEGDLRGKWQTTLNSSASNDKLRKDRNGTFAKKETVKTVDRLNGDGTVYFTNLAPYSEVVEDGLYPTKNADKEGSKVNNEGFSKKAPSGMVKKNIPRFDTLVKQKANEVGFD